MGYASRAGRARTSARTPMAHAICDRCSFRYNHVNLRFQHDYAGSGVVNKRMLVCDTCLDQMQNQLKAIVLPADPMPIANPRPEPMAWDTTDYRQVSGNNTVNPWTGIPVPAGDIRVTSENNQPTPDKRVTQQTGEPPNGKNQKPGTDPNAVTYRNVTNAYNNGSGNVRLVVGNTNGMITGQYVIVQDVGGVTGASGTFQITVIDSQTIDLRLSTFGGVYTSGGYVIDYPGVPYGFDEIPKTGTL